ncbi:unnamed protein product [Trichobilharzia regenti]|nr:unnamed protein product [Trichobilharzia regenti]
MTGGINTGKWDRLLLSRFKTTSTKYLTKNNGKHWSRLGVKPDAEPGCPIVDQEVDTGMKTVVRVPSRQLAARTSGGSAEAYMQPKPVNMRYNPRMYDGGLLPRLDYTDRQVVLPEFKPRDMWAPHRAYFGQNDYIGTLTNRLYIYGL